MLNRISSKEFRALMRRCQPLGQKLTEEINQYTNENCEPGEHQAMAGLVCQMMMVSIMLGVYKYDLSVGRTPVKLGEQCTMLAQQLKRILLNIADDNDIDVTDIEAELEAQAE